MDIEERIASLEQRVQTLERLRVRDNNVRFKTILSVNSYLVSAGLRGDYCEFGVGEGKTFSFAVHTLARKYPHMRFWGFDTFTGMPTPQGLDAQMSFDTGYVQGKFAHSEKEVRDTVLYYSPEIESGRVITVPGLFSDTLPKQMTEISKISVAFIDPIFYESTVTVLDFLTEKISIGSVIIFDDWFAMRNLPEYGNQRACKEWLEKTKIRLSPFFQFGGTGMVFTVQGMG